MSPLSRSLGTYGRSHVGHRRVNREQQTAVTISPASPVNKYLPMSFISTTTFKDVRCATYMKVVFKKKLHFLSDVCVFNMQHVSYSVATYHKAAIQSIIYR